MKKKRKKHHPPVNETASRAHHRNEFLKHINQLCSDLTGRNVFKLMPPSVQEWMYNNRLQTPRVMAAPGHHIKNSLLKQIKLFLGYYLKNAKISISKEGPEVTVSDFYTYWISLMLCTDHLKEDEFPGAAEFKNALEPHLHIEELYKPAGTDLLECARTITYMHSDYRENIYCFKEETRKFIDGKRGVYKCTDIYSFVPEKIHVMIEGINRPVTRIGWAHAYPEPRYLATNIQPEVLEKVHHTIKKPVPVYIQNHALQRLHERIDTPHTGWLHFGLCESCVRPVIHNAGSGNILIEYRMFGVKTGYLRAKFHDNILLIHTFLFLTNNGTPEGEMLRQNTGMEKEDKKYLEIDKLSTFVTSDIKNNDKLKDIFIKAGCESLFQIDPKLLYPPGKEIKEKTLAMHIAQYLGLDKDEEFMKECEDLEEEYAGENEE